MVEPHVRKRSPGHLWSRVRLSLGSSVKLWHAIYFPVVLIALTIIFCAAGGVRGGFIDAVFLSVTTFTGAGLLATANSELSTVQQVFLTLGIISGGHVFIGIAVVNLQRVLLARKLRRRAREDREMENAPTAVGSPVLSRTPSVDSVHSHRSVHQEVQLLPLKVEEAVGESRPSMHQEDEDDLGQDEQRYRALCLLSWALPVYHLFFHIIAFVILGAWMHAFGGEILDVDGHNLNPWWWALFNATSAFANSGMSLLDANMAPFQTGAVTVVLVHCVLILAGNAGFPTFLQGLLMILPKRWGAANITRKTFPFLVPRYERNWLAAMLLILNCINWFAYCIAGTQTYPLSTSLTDSSIILTGLFQAVSVRSGGFGIVDMSELHVVVVILYICMMYLSAFPVTLSSSPFPGRKRAFIQHQLQGLTRAGDIKFLALALFVIAAIEGFPSSDLVKVVFEIASAYGCVGVSFGRQPGEALLAGWTRPSRVIAAAVMLLGRTRELRRGILRDW